MSTPRKQIQGLLLAGILPVVLFTLIEEQFGTLWGLVAGMIFGVGEILWERVRNGRVQAITWAGNGLLLLLGAVSLLTQEGVWFKLQPALINACLGLLLSGSLLIGRPLLVEVAERQGAWASLKPEVLPLFRKAFAGITFRSGLFCLAHAALGVWAALTWSTRAWALLKGVGFTGSLLLYWVAEIGFLRYRISTLNRAR